MKDTNTKKMASKGVKKVAPLSQVEQRSKLAQRLLAPNLRHGQLASTFVEALLNGTKAEEKPDLTDFYLALSAASSKTEMGDLSIASRLLVAQAMSLDGIFTEMARRAAANMREYPQAMEIFMRLALKAQAGSRATLAELTKLHQPREQTVRHVHVNQGGQAIVADNFHQQTGGKENGKIGDQSHATGPAGASASLPSPDPFGNGVPIPGREGPQAVPHARGHESGCA